MTGYGIMALFGAPDALENAPQRALCSALSIHRDIAEFNGQEKRRRANDPGQPKGLFINFANF